MKTRALGPPCELVYDNVKPHSELNRRLAAYLRLMPKPIVPPSHHASETISLIRHKKTCCESVQEPLTFVRSEQQVSPSSELFHAYWYSILRVFSVYSGGVSKTWSTRGVRIVYGRRHIPVPPSVVARPPSVVARYAGRVPSN